MITVDYITELLCRVDDVLGKEHVHAQAHLHPSGLATIALLKVSELSTQGLARPVAHQA